jgi:hypothetical protein
MKANLKDRLIAAAVTGFWTLTIAVFFASCDLFTNPEDNCPKKEILDQFCYPENGGGGLEVTKDQPVIQTFTASVTGQLTRIVIPEIHHHRCTPTENLVFELVHLDSTTLQDSSLIRMEFPPDSVSSLDEPSWELEIDLKSHGINVSAGEVLGIRFSCLCPGNGCTYAWSGELEAYDRGETIIHGARNLRDMVFETYVLPQQRQ